MHKKNNLTLSSYIDANIPILYINTCDFHAFDMMLENINKDICAKIYEFNEGTGYVNIKTKLPMSGQWTAENFLSLLLENTDEQNFIVLKDFHHQLENPKIIALLKSIALRVMNDAQYCTTVFIVSTKVVIPVELEKLITMYEIPLPDKDICISIIKNFANDVGIKIREQVMLTLASHLKGFSEFEIRQILTLAYQQSGALEESDIEFIRGEKEHIIKKTGMLKIMHYQDDMEAVGGLENLKEWVKKKAEIFKKLEQAIQYGVAIPKGVLIVGMPGCGKSLTAKATANLFNIPLLQLDVGKLLGKYIGESEENMRRALSIAEAISPTVLWIDEIEKAFSGVGSERGHEVTTRLFGYFLTWLQEKDSSVFVVATSNDISTLPPEFLRKGRFDEIFFVDFPNKIEREQIIKLHLQKRNKLHNGINLQKLANKTEQYTGADIEGVILNAIEKAFLDGAAELTTDAIIQEIESTKPMAIALKDKIERLQQSLENLDVKPASIT